MVHPKKSSKSIETKGTKSWPYYEYYVGEKDPDNRRSGYGVNTWSGAKSLENYDGNFICDTMHGSGEYRWRFHGEDGIPCTYEGYFYNNCMHGYGLISFPDGRTFRGLFNNNMRWGPGIQSHTALRDDVGLWKGTQLIRLAWRPQAPSVVPDFTSNNIGRMIVEGHRKLLTNTVTHIGETNCALDLLKNCGADPRLAVEEWKKLYPKHCTDLASPLCQVEIFNRDYYKDRIESLEEVNNNVQFEDTQESFQKEKLYAWNNSNIIINMMKHCYEHEKQRDNYEIDLNTILSGPRKLFKMAGAHEADCRTLLLTSYLGYIANVAELINKHNVNPNVADIQGNTALMYATCGDQVDTISFLVDAGADIDCFNDSCCTSLGVALMRFTCAVNDVPPNLIQQSLLPPPIVPAPPPTEPRASEWHLSRDLASQGTTVTLIKSSSKTVRSLSQKKVKSQMSIKDQNMGRRKTETTSVKAPETEYDSDDSLSENKKVYSNANREFTSKVNDIFQQPNTNHTVPYLFEINDMVMEVEALEEEPKKVQDKNVKKVVSKVMKDTVKTSKELVWSSSDKVESENSIEKQRHKMLEQMKLTILELLTQGAKPQLVRCPQPALVIAISSNCPDLIKHLVQYGADVNEIYPQILGYSPLDIAVSKPFTLENLEIVRVLLESGANAKRCIYYDDTDSSDITVYKPHKLGPTLLHAVIARRAENENEEEVRQLLLNLLLDYNCDPTSQFKGRSAIDLVMSTNIALFDVFIRNPKTDLNCIINDINQNVLVKMFWIPFFKNVPNTEKIQTLTNLLLYGADPLLPCQNGQERYENIFVFAKNSLSELDNTQVKASNQKGKKPDKPKKDEKLTTKSVGKMVTDDKEDYRQAIELVKECARLLHIRWLQGKLVKELISIIDKFKHRQWNMILIECKSKKRIGLWITPHRCLEIWNILATKRNKIYRDQRILKHLLSIVTFLAWRFYRPKNNEFKASSKVTAIVRDLVDKDVFYLLKEYKSTRKDAPDEMQWNSQYVKPELDRDNQKFYVCFECTLPLNQDKVLCNICKIVSFCSYECMKVNIERIGCHPCSEDLKAKYFQSPNYSLPSSADSPRNKI
ncbi:LOW QUALITY PROTEIN: ankyrin repeat and MYND domain-containing protein 1-like [Colias croceus]|uniref:LOW QUALITY PROTEIN: ankyrin repeat and MYND domain-containing protein 1-like n=1 Tax=Colias crocea TaxID=72248 RepID=UPI001E27DA68|nr:LOW QUALITY PROTEIN: ankyrin repeat and MYND domain-containing protein 1-like [Colias croceus]